jgi:MFS family permease
VIAYWHALKAFNRNVRLYLITAVLMGLTIFGGIYGLLINLYLLRLGYGPEFIGMVHAAGMLGWALACLPAGRIGRWLGSRRAMMAGMGLGGLGYGALTFAQDVPVAWRAAWIVGSYLAGNLLIALYDVNQGPFLMDATTPRERDHVFSVQAALWPLAGFAGSLIGGLLPGLFAGALNVSTDDPTPYRYPLLIAAALLFLAIWALQGTRDPITHAQAADGTDRPDAATGERRAAGASVAKSARYIIVFLSLVVVLQGMGEGAVRTFFSVYMDAGLRAATAQIGALAAVGQFLGVPAALAMPLLAARWGRRRTFVWGSLGMAASLLPLALIPVLSAAGLGYMAMMATASIVRPALTVYLLESVPPEWRTTMSAAATMALGLSWAAISLGGGYAITLLGYPAFFLASAALTAAGVVVFLANPRLGWRRQDAQDGQDLAGWTG